MEHLDFGGLNNGLQESSEWEKLVKIDVTGVKKYVCWKVFKIEVKKRS